MLIVDLKMPRMNGKEVLQWIKEHPKCSVVPTLILSSSNHPADVEECYRLGANAYMVKPADLDSLKEVFRRLYDFWACCELPAVPGKC